MFKLAQYMGNLQALHTMGLIPQESLQTIGLQPQEVSGYGRGGRTGLTPYVPGYHDFPTPERAGGVGNTLRKVGPAAGVALGGLGGLLLRKRLGGAARGAFEGVGAGALAGWLPDVFMTAGEELSS